jgi:hypothetical protein
LFKGFGRPEVVVMDVTETAIERKKKHRKNTIQKIKNTTA